jgi:Fe-S-cluster containining protein
MGEIIRLREEIGPFRFRIWYTPTGEEREVVVDPDKQYLFESPVDERRISLACPFLRQRGAHEKICVVHLSRPDLCRQYSCFRMLILDKDGRKVGRVMDGSRYLTATDPRLQELWANECAGLLIPDEALWEDTVTGVLTREGYRIIR